MSPAKHAISIALLTASLLFVTGCIKTDPASIREFVMEEIHGQFPDAGLEDAGENAIAVRHRDGNLQVIDISLIQEGCRRAPRSCGGLVARLLVIMQEGIAAQAAELSIARVIPIISALAPAKGLVKQNEPGRIHVQPIAEGLAVQFAIVTGDTFSILDDAKLEKLGASPEVLLNESLKNVEAVATVIVVAFPGESGVFQATGWLAGSGILARKHTESVKAKLNCRELAIAFPRRGMVLFANADDAPGVARLREISARFLQPPSAVISREIYLLTSGGLSVMRK